MSASPIPVPFTQEEIADLERLLLRLKENNGFWPSEKTMRLAHNCIPHPATELVILRDGPKDPQILLAVYSDAVEKFKGLWHIPGGYMKWGAGLQDSCNRIAQRELNMDVTYVYTIDAYQWKPEEHLYGSPVSIYAYCEVLGKVIESETLKWFSLKALPENMVEPHRNFVQATLRR